MNDDRRLYERLNCIIYVDFLKALSIVAYPSFIGRLTLKSLFSRVWTRWPRIPQYSPRQILEHENEHENDMKSKLNLRNWVVHRTQAKSYHFSIFSTTYQPTKTFLSSNIS